MLVCLDCGTSRHCPARRMITKRIDAMSGGAQAAEPRSAAISPRQAGWLLGLLSLVVVLLECGGDVIRYLCRYERAAIMQGEYWRLLSGHLVHDSWSHLIENLAGLGLVAALFSRDYSLRQWILVLLLSSICIDIGFVCNEPQLEWYVGLSGVLHGALAAGAVAWWRFESKVLATVLTCIFVGKLGWEQVRGALPSASDMAVVVDAHLYGAMGGLMAGLLFWGAVRYPWPRRDASL
jgi:rhomboid family GlyGly-CTERM serine protease